MARPEPRLQSRLLLWLLGPLLLLLALDTAVSYWSALNFSNRAHDRSLLEIARELALHVKANGSSPRVEISPAAERVLLIDTDDRLAYRVSAEDGALIGGDAQIERPAARWGKGADPLFYGGTHHGEPVRMVAEVNELMQRLGKTLDFQNRFIADAAHQLKTPVAGLKAQIELALREGDPQRVRHSLAQLYVGADRMSRLVQQLLSLARNEPGATDAVQLKPVDLDAFALEISMEWVPLAIKQGVDLGFESAGRPVWVDAEPDRLREMVNNLIDNAVRYSHQGGRVTVAVAAADAGTSRLSISDDGPAIPVEERARVFERFHRLLGTHTDGSGLGLAIVSEIAKLHGASITLEEDQDGVGNTFSVAFPASQLADSLATTG